MLDIALKDEITRVLDALPANHVAEVLDFALFVYARQHQGQKRVDQLYSVPPADTGHSAGLSGTPIDMSADRLCGLD